MKRILTLLFLIISCSLYAQTVHRVTNGMNLQTVIDNANNGDVIMVEGGSYGNINIAKAIKLYGTGYFINGALVNPNTQATVSPTILGNLQVNHNSVEIGGLTFDNIHIMQNQANVLNCKFTSVLVEASLKNILISSCLFRYFEIKENSSGILIKNNIIGSIYRDYYSSRSGLINRGVTSTFLNNTFTGDESYIDDSNGNNGTYANNIFPRSLFGGLINDHNTFKHNIFSNWYYTAVDNRVDMTNKTIQNYNELFLNESHLPEDARYQLSPNSPARSAGVGGTDAGAFGGDMPYVLSGLPKIPVIYYLETNPQVTQGGTLQVQIKAKTNN